MATKMTEVLLFFRAELEEMDEDEEMEIMQGFCMDGTPRQLAQFKACRKRFKERASRSG